MCKVLIATGGTGGHVFPAIALGEFLKKNNVNIVFTGRKNSVEERLVKEKIFKFINIDAKRFKGENIFNKILTIFKMIFLIFAGLKILHRENVDYIIGTGGYVAAPLVFAGILKGVKTGICEQNAFMGFGNRILSCFVNDIFLTFKKTFNVPMGYKSMVTGNFIREEFEREKSKKGILIFGGSQGAVKINELFCSILDELKKYDNIKIFHITGERDFEKVKKVYDEKGKGLNYEIYPFYNKMFEIFKKIDFVISRAGATSISEIYYNNKRAILIPYPYAADNHQWFNAMEFCKTGRGVILKEKNLTGDKLIKWIKFFIDNDLRFKSNYEPIGDFEKGKSMILEKVKNSH